MHQVHDLSRGREPINIHANPFKMGTHFIKWSYAVAEGTDDGLEAGGVGTGPPAEDPVGIMDSLGIDGIAGEFAQRQSCCRRSFWTVYSR